jgi:hypothetical protein
MMAHYAIRGLMHEAALKANEDPDRLLFLHAARVVRPKIASFTATPLRGQECNSRISPATDSGRTRCIEQNAPQPLWCEEENEWLSSLSEGAQKN